MKKTLVIGASDNPMRTAFEAVHKLRSRGHEVIALGKKPGTVADVTIRTELSQLETGNLHTVSLYLNPAHQAAIMDDVLALKPLRIFFNPGTENPEFIRRATAAGIECEAGCMLVALSTGQF